MASLNLSNSPAGVSVKLKPLVLFNICDAYIRRNESQARVIGTLLGHIADGVVHIQNCYAVPHNESNDQVRDERPLGSTADHIYIGDLELVFEVSAQRASQKAAMRP